MKRIFALLIVLTTANLAFSQTTEAEKDLKEQVPDTIKNGWRTGGVVSLNFTQVSLTNWAAGGNNSISLNGIASLYANLKKGNSTWDNSLDLGYGLLKQDEEGVRKTDDKLDFMSKYGQKAFNHWYYAGLVNFKSQMAPGYNYPDDSTVISRFLAPGYILGAIGMDYKPSDAFTLFISPLTTKMTIVADEKLANAGAFGVDAATYDETTGKIITKGKMLRSEYGGYLRAILNKEVMKNIKLITKLELFSDYLEHPDHIDVNWEVLLALKVNDYISATVFTQLIYDHDIDIAVDENNDGVIDAFGPRVQFKEVLGIGFTYKF